MKRLLSILFLSFLYLGAFAQSVYVPGSHNVWDLNDDNRADLKTNLGATGYYGKTIQPSVNDEFKIAFNDWSVNWGCGYVIPGEGHLNTVWTIGYGTNVNAKWNGSNIGELKQYVHLTIKNPQDYIGANLPVGIMTLSAIPAQINNVTAPAVVRKGDKFTVQVSLDKAPCLEEHIYVRYSNDNFSSFHLAEVICTDASGSVQIDLPETGTYNFYTFSSTLDLSTLNNESDIDLVTINYNNNDGHNYTVDVADNRVSIDPQMPHRTQPFTITFDAAGTTLEGAEKVYFHSGIATDGPNSTSFNTAVGNWGQDDGVGLMIKTPGSVNTWEITIPDAVSYYGLTDTQDAFGLNFLFRSADGSIKEDGLKHENYHFEMNPGTFWFFTNNPGYSPFLTEEAVPFAVTATANVAVDWTLEETDAGMNNPVVVTQQTNTVFSFNHEIPNLELHYFRLKAELNGETKYKTFSVKGYSSVVTAPRPENTVAGINYYSDDPSKVTLVLHTPTSTNYKKGTGTVSGSNTTPAKKVVYAIGDFNNWQVEEAYKMKKDGDYWWITLDDLEAGKEYAFQYLVDGEIRMADPYTRKVSDPADGDISSAVYPDLKPYPYGKTSEIASVFQTNQENYSWEVNDFNRPASNELNIYELHFRDFTTEGTFKAATQKLDYLKELGINCIHVMPVSEFENNDSWGYNPNFYFALDKAYGTAKDFKRFVDQAHKRGIAVVNDLVLNHAFHSNVMARLYWDKANNRPAAYNPWFNAEHRGVYASAGHWGADWNHESEHTQALIDAILDFWITEYNLDGFRFDFTKGFTQTAPDEDDPWASTYDQDRVDLLKRMVDNMWSQHPGTYAIFEHLANDAEDKALADHGILMWSGAGPQEPYKNLALGYDDNNNYSIWSSVYLSRNFTYANFVSYIESHDEQRLGYEVFSYAKNVKSLTGEEKTEAAIDRLKMISAFNGLLPGPRMIWQFEELGYDISIDENGRTGRKPVRWDYYEDAHRKELYRVYSLIFNLRQRYDFYTTSDYGNIGRNDLATPRRMAYKDNEGNQVIVIANFDPDNGKDIQPGYSEAGTWYQYNGDPTVDGTTFNVSATTDNFHLQPSGFRILTNFDATAEQTISFDPVASVTYGDEAFHLHATSTSGLPLSYSIISGPASLEGDVLTIRGAGEVELKGSQAGTAAYDPVQTTYSFTVEKAPLSVKAENNTKVYKEELPDLTYSFSGFVNGENEASAGVTGTPELVTTATANTSVSESPVTITIDEGTLQASNYTFSFVNGLLDIDKASQTITFDPVSDKTMNDDDFNLVVTATSGLPVKVESGDESIVSMSGNLVAIHQSGSVVLTASQPGDENYLAAEPVEQTLKVSTVTGIHDEHNGFRVYPSPANAYIKVDVSGSIEQLNIYNSLGTVVKMMTEVNGDNVIPVSELVPGYYIIQIIAGGNSYQTRFVKE
ncbi:T9SS C-terminal target domain-containing protein [Marinilabiliaceae bacterium JC017]|nr:T9SS C-terminal target domain-containing protein [Marinilabiliaceae bacterium JC017]